MRTHRPTTRRARQEVNRDKIVASCKRALTTLKMDIEALNGDAARPVHIARDAGMVDASKIGRYCPHHTTDPDVAYIAELRKWIVAGERLILRAEANRA